MLSWKLVKRRLVMKAKSKLALLSKALKEGLSLKAGENVWEVIVRPTLEYGSEIWGSIRFEAAERIQADAGRKLLAVSGKTASAAVRGDFGWWTMRARRDLKRLSYWGRLCRMKGNRLLRAVYLQSKNRAGRNEWCSQTKQLLVSLGLGHLWQTEQVGGEKDWKNLVRSCIKAREQKEWLAKIDQTPKLRVYRTLKRELVREDYLELDVEERRSIAMMRSGTNPLRVEQGRWKREKLAERTCLLCVQGKIETEQHFLLECWVMERERRLLFKNILAATGYDIRLMRDDAQWVLEVCLGVGLPQQETRREIWKAVAGFIAVALERRKKLLAL